MRFSYLIYSDLIVRPIQRLSPLVKCPKRLHSLSGSGRPIITAWSLAALSPSHQDAQSSYYGTVWCSPTSKVLYSSALTRCQNRCCMPLWPLTSISPCLCPEASQVLCRNRRGHSCSPILILYWDCYCSCVPGSTVISKDFDSRETTRPRSDFLSSPHSLASWHWLSWIGSPRLSRAYWWTLWCFLSFCDSAIAFGPQLSVSLNFFYSTPRLLYSPSSCKSLYRPCPWPDVWDTSRMTS